MIEESKTEDPKALQVRPVEAKASIVPARLATKTEDPKAVQLLGEVLEKTRADKLQWEPTVMEERFTAALGGKFSLVIECPRDGYVALDLHDQQGRRLISVSTGSLGDGGRVLPELYELARGRALNTDAAVDSVLESLRKL